MRNHVHFGENDGGKIEIQKISGRVDDNEGVFLGGEEAKPEPRKSDSHGGRFGEEDLYRRMRAHQAVS